MTDITKIKTTLSPEEKWRRILALRLKNLGYSTFDPQAIKDIAAMLQHYEYDPDFIFWKHQEDIENMS